MAALPSGLSVEAGDDFSVHPEVYHVGFPSGVPDSGDFALYDGTDHDDGTTTF